MLEMGRLDRAARRRIHGLVRKGEAASTPGDARLVVALARQSLGAWRVAVGAAVALAILAGISAFFQIRHQDWFLLAGDVLVVALALAYSALVRFVHVPRLRRAERLNVPIAEESGRA
jgi:hypothetical protein